MIAASFRVSPMVSFTPVSVGVKLDIAHGAPGIPRLGARFQRDASGRRPLSRAYRPFAGPGREGRLRVDLIRKWVGGRAPASCFAASEGYRP